MTLTLGKQLLIVKTRPLLMAAEKISRIQRVSQLLFWIWAMCLDVIQGNHYETCTQIIIWLHWNRSTQRRAWINAPITPSSAQLLNHALIVWGDQWQIAARSISLLLSPPDISGQPQIGDALEHFIANCWIIITEKSGWSPTWFTSFWRHFTTTSLYRFWPKTVRIHWFQP